MNILKKTLLSLILVLTMFTSVISVNYVRAEDDSDSSNENTSETTSSVNSLPSNNLAFSLLDSNLSEITTVQEGQDVVIRATFDLAESVNSTYLTIDLGELKYISVGEGQKNVELKSNKDNVIGHFDVESNTANDKTTYSIKIKLDYDQIKKDAESYPYKCILNISGSISLGNNDQPQDGKIELDIGGTKKTLTYKPADSKVSISKSSLGEGNDDTSDGLKYVAGSDDDDSSYFYKKFKVELSSNGDNSNVVITDTLSSDKLSFVTEADETNGISAPTLKKGTDEVSDLKVSVDGTKMTVTETNENTKLEKDSTATLEYWVKFKKSDYSSVNNAKNSAVVTYTNNNGDSSSNTADTYTFNLGTPGIEKTATKVDVESTDANTNTKKVKWTITISPTSYYDGYVLKDEETLCGDTTNSSSNPRLTESGVAKIYLQNDESSTESSAWYMTAENLKNGKLSFTTGTSTNASTSDSNTLGEVKINPNGKNIIIEYTNTYDVSEVDITKGLTTTNKATITNESLNMSEDVTAGYNFVPGQGLSIYKEYTSYDPSTGKIEWKVTVIQPSDFTDIVITDNPNGISMNSDLKVAKSKGDGTMDTASEATWTQENGVYKYTLEGAVEYTGTVTNYDDYTAKYKKYVLTYSSNITGDKGISGVDNKVGATYKYNGNEGTFNGATYGDQNFKVLVSKSGNPIDSISGKQEWTVKFDVEAMDFTGSNTVTVKDILPENIELISDSFTLGSTSISSDDIKLSTSTEDGKQTFSADLTDKLKSYKTSYTSNNTSSKYVYLKYKTRFISLSKAYENTNTGGSAVNYTNSITATYAGNTITESGTAYNCTFKPDDSVSKTSSYDIKSPNKIKYTIEMNKGGAHLAKDGESTLSVTDKAGKSLIYIYDEDKKEGINVTADGVAYTEFEVEILASEDGSTMTISNLPDEKKIVIIYSCQINVPANTNTATITDGSVSNGIETTLADGVTFSKQDSVKQTIKLANGAAYPVNASLKLTKVDSSDSSKKLSGAVYMAYIMVIDNGELRKATEADDVAKNYSLDPIYSKATDEDGFTKIEGMKYNLIYCIEEYKAPDGYELSDEKLYVLYDGENSGVTTTTITDSELTGLDVKHIYNYIGTYTATVSDSKLPDTPSNPDDGGTTDPKDNGNNNGGGRRTEANTPCEEWHKSKDWTWSEKTKTCVYRVSNTSSR